jgi:hypothetical protein
MKNLLFTTLLTIFLSNILSAQVARFNLFGESSPATSPADATDPNLTVSSLTRGLTAAASAAGNSFRTTGFQNNGIATTNTDYFQVTLQATSGNKVSLTTLSGKLAGTSGFAVSPGVMSQFAYSLDGVAFTLIGSPTTTIGTPATFSVSVSSIPALQDVPTGTTITLRYYASGQTTTGGWGFNSPTAAATDDGLSIAGTVSALPVELFKFNALTSKNKVNLLFTTASEKDNAYFAIERSNDGAIFSAIGRVEGKGTTTTLQNYTFIDESPLNGRNFYRLKQVDTNGKFEYSPVKMVAFGRNNAIQLVPTQADDFMEINLDKALSENTTWEITNIEGKTVKSGTFNAETTNQRIETYDLQAGQYFVRLLDANQPMIAKFVKL